MEAEKARPGLTMFTDGSRMEDGAAGYAVVWRKGESWAGIKTHMGYNQRPTARSVSPSHMHWDRLREETQSRNGSRSSRMHKRPSDGWHRTNLALGNDTPSRRGSISPLCAGLGQASSSKSGGARLTRESQTTRRPTSGQRPRQRSQTPAGSSG